METLISPQMLVYVAGAFYVLGLLIINQIVLRLMVLAGTGFYLIYYSTIAAEPLWEAIYISLLIGAANIIGLAGLLARQSHLALPRAHRDIYHHFPGLPPGDFRTLLRLAERRVAEDDIILTTENTVLNKLYYVIDGHTIVLKQGDQFNVPAKTFVGEVAYLSGEMASASTMLTKGSEYLEWSAPALHQASARSVRFKMALEAVLSLDLAAKVARSVAPYTPVWRPELAQAPTEPKTTH